ncbi:AI-2E family transporter [Phycisphaerales bacterium AB-hyl4]|uniref:AI-2E family transporter n=1 Tax=Natronomicrosphaera hydrolytica TaxID=3242702 RepID=A0ABV4U4P2_9BACT
MPEIEEPVWRKQWFQRLLVVLVAAATAVLVVPPVLALLYAVRPVLLPVMIGLALAYTVNPLATWLHRRWRVPRPVTAVVTMAAVVVAVLGLSAYLVPKLVTQTRQFIRDLPGYAEALANHLAGRFELDLEQVVARIEERARGLLAGDGQELDFGAIGAAVWQWLDVGLGVIGTTIGLATYLVVAAVVVFFCFFFFVWKFDGIVRWFAPFVPARHQPRTFEIVGMMDKSVSAFIRGRLIQATVVAVVLSVGWWIVGVPYWLLLGIGSGFLNLIPYAAVVGWPVAVGLTWLDSLTAGGASEVANGAAAAGDAAASGFDLWGIVIWPSVVYLIAQGLDGWVIEPVVQGQATNLDPLTVLLVVLLGGSLLGLLGLLIAIPLAACIKILAKEVLLPRLRQWAAAEA